MENLKYKSTLSLIGLSIITLGVYPAYFIKRQTKILNDYKTNAQVSKRLTTLIIAIAYIIGILFLFVLIGLFRITLPNMKDLITLSPSSFFSLFTSTFSTIWCFLARDRIHEYFNIDHNPFKRISGLLLLMFGVFYLNYKINRNSEIS